MKTSLYRIVSLLLAACLLADPTWAVALSQQQPMLGHSAVTGVDFQEQAFANRALNIGAHPLQTITEYQGLTQGTSAGFFMLHPAALKVGLSFLGGPQVLGHLIAALLAYNAVLLWSNRRRRRFERILATYVGHERRLLSKYHGPLATIQPYALVLGTALFGLANVSWLSTAGAALFVWGVILEWISLKIPKDQPARAAPANRDPLDQIFRTTVRDALLHQPDENIMGVIVIEPERGSQAMASNASRAIMLVKGTGVSFLVYETADRDFMAYFHGYFPDSKLTLLPSLILNADGDQNTGSASLDIIISMYFVPPHQLKGLTVYSAPTAGAAFVKSFDVIARTSAQEEMITNLINQRIKVLSTGKGFGEAFGPTLRSHWMAGFAIFLAFAWWWLFGPSTTPVFAANLPDPMDWVVNLLPHQTRHALDQSGRMAVKDIQQFLKLVLDNPIGDVLFKAGLAIAFAKGIHEQFTKPKVSVDFNEVPMKPGKWWQQSNPKRYLSYLGISSSMNIEFWLIILLIVTDSGHIEPSFLAFLFLLMAVSRLGFRRLLFKPLVKRIEHPQSLLRLYQGQLPLLEATPEELKVKAIGYKFTFERWRFRHEAVLWLKEPYVLRRIGLIFPFAQYIYPIEGNWKNAKDAAKEWVKGLSPRGLSVPATVPVRNFWALHAA